MNDENSLINISSDAIDKTYQWEMSGRARGIEGRAYFRERCVETMRFRFARRNFDLTQSESLTLRL